MINNKIILVAGTAALSASLLSTTATAATVTATGNANVLTPLSITENTQMEFGDVAGLVASDSTVNLTTAGGTSSSDGATVFGTGSTDAAGSFTVNGSGNLAYTISLPADSVVTLTGTGFPMDVDGFIHNAGGSPALAAGTATFAVGATLTIPGGQTADAYSGSYDVTVNYQ